MKADALADGYEAFKYLHLASPDVDFKALVVCVDDLNVALLAIGRIGVKPADVVAFVERWAVSCPRHGKEFDT